jgi:hypothetical protein
MIESQEVGERRCNLPGADVTGAVIRSVSRPRELKD